MAAAGMATSIHHFKCSIQPSCQITHKEAKLWFVAISELINYGLHSASKSWFDDSLKTSVCANYALQDA